MSAQCASEVEFKTKMVPSHFKWVTPPYYNQVSR